MSPSAPGLFSGAAGSPKDALRSGTPKSVQLCMPSILKGESSPRSAAEEALPSCHGHVEIALPLFAGPRGEKNAQEVCSPSGKMYLWVGGEGASPNGKSSDCESSKAGATTCCPQTELDQCETGSTCTSELVRCDSVWVEKQMLRRFQDCQDAMSRITGTPGDVARDEQMAFGESTLTFKDVCFKMKGKTILEPISGHFKPGTLAAVMGPSGSGKTTLLDILADKKTTPWEGTVHFNGRPRDKLFRRMTSYVPQNDVMPAHLTVQEAVQFAYDLKNPAPSKVNGKLRQWDIESRLAILGLLCVRNSRIGDEAKRGISGGQQKRVSLARGLNAAAQIIFCDEPTSGLSATDAEMCVKYMRLLAHKFGITIVVVIHQPRFETSRLFDHLLLMTAEPGRCVYNGPMAEALDHWQKVGYPLKMCVNPTDHFLDLVTPGMPNSAEAEFVAYYNEHCAPAVRARVEEEIGRERATSLELLNARRESLLQFGYLPQIKNTVYGVPFFRQFQIVFTRQLKLAARDSMGGVLELLIAPIKALIVGVTYLDIGSRDAVQQLGFIFMVLMMSTIDGLKVMPQLISQRSVMKIETSEALYSQWIFIMSFTIINSLVAFLSNLIFVSVLFEISGTDYALFNSLVLWTTMLQFCFDNLYLMMASIARDATAAQICSIPLMIFFLLYNGFTATKKTVPDFMAWVLDVSPVAYAMEAVCIAYGDVYTEDPFWKVIHERNGYVRQTDRAIMVVAGYIVLFRTIQIVCMRYMNNIKR
eukprot:TRINITY_DN4576_c0_g1_i2.p1 TRINITY_DN4576_c0_g1~~TRINITY_DN4576_c0_g1_i2.p1  ORF type:complete len:759 (+),score=147.36 TRINITY_DN4576_c0_g1_i2:104-2380(+)